MPTPGDDSTSREHRGTSAHKGARGIANKGTARREPERNVPSGPVVHQVKDRVYRIYGLDIGDTNFSSRGIPQGLAPAVDTYKRTPGSKLRIIAGESPSVYAGPPGLARRRAEALREQLKSQGALESDIEIQESPPSKEDPKKVKAQTKAQLRGATVEVVLPKKVSSTPREFTDGITYIKGQPKWQWEWKWPPPPPLDPWVKTIKDPGREKEKEEGKEKGKDPGQEHWIDWQKVLRRKQPASSPFLLQAAVIGLLAYAFLPELLAGALIEYGKKYGEKKVKEFLEKKIKKKLKEGNKRNRTEEARFMREMLRRINAAGIDPTRKHHPLYFLVDPNTGDWKSRRVDETGYGIQPGHTLSHKGYGFAYALEGAWENQAFRNAKIETPGGEAFSVAIIIDDVYVDLITATRYESMGGALPKGTVRRARKSVGWIDFTGIASQALDDEE